MLLLASEAISNQGSLTATTNSSLAPDRFERAPHRIEREINLNGLNVEWRREAHDPFSIQCPVDDNSIGERGGHEAMRECSLVKFNSDKQSDSAHRGDLKRLEAVDTSNYLRAESMCAPGQPLTLDNFQTRKPGCARERMTSEGGDVP